MGSIPQDVFDRQPHISPDGPPRAERVASRADLKFEISAGPDLVWRPKLQSLLKNTCLLHHLHLHLHLSQHLSYLRFVGTPFYPFHFLTISPRLRQRQTLSRLRNALLVMSLLLCRIVEGPGSFRDVVWKGCAHAELDRRGKCDCIFRFQ